ncbi:exported protein of unknown function (plasmid) [Ralstonia solanacearum CMR15]|nr:exported protein of unknown function [Ralstonia solanacearum CMR15]
MVRWPAVAAFLSGLLHGCLALAVNPVLQVSVPFCTWLRGLPGEALAIHPILTEHEASHENGNADEERRSHPQSDSGPRAA